MLNHELPRFPLVRLTFANRQYQHVNLIALLGDVGGAFIRATDDLSVTALRAYPTIIFIFG